jgi:hypothetical protein
MTMLNARKFCLSRCFVVFFLITLTACSQQKTISVPPAIPPEAAFVANRNTSLMPHPKPIEHFKVRVGKHIEAIFFPQDLPPPPEKEGESMMGLASGKLVLQKGCLRVDDDANSKLLIWPGWLTFSIEDNIIRIKYPTHWHKQSEQLKIGDTVDIDGGNTDRPNQKFLAQPIPDECQGPYFSAGGIEHFTPEQIHE